MLGHRHEIVEQVYSNDAFIFGRKLGHCRDYFLV